MMLFIWWSTVPFFPELSAGLVMTGHNN
uniref:Uncharacterized protein n=1 Tax=Arundo donax TaxID=35708 RepID=A0A0A8YQ58_ARUDO